MYRPGEGIDGPLADNECCQPNGVIIPIGTLAAQPPAEWCRPNRGRCILRPVGTRGAVGWMRGPGACPGGDETGWPHATQITRQATRTSTRPPPVSTSTPCPYRTQADIPNHSPIRLAKIIIGDVHEVLIRAPLRFAEASTTWPVLVIKLHYRLWAR